MLSWVKKAIRHNILYGRPLILPQSLWCFPSFICSWSNKPHLRTWVLCTVSKLLIIKNCSFLGFGIWDDWQWFNGKLLQISLKYPTFEWFFFMTLYWQSKSKNFQYFVGWKARQKTNFGFKVYFILVQNRQTLKTGGTSLYSLFCFTLPL